MPRARINSIYQELSSFFRDQNALFLLGASFVIFIASTEFLASVQLALDIAISGVPIILAFISVLIFLWFATKGSSSNARISIIKNSLILFMVLFSVALFASGYFFDLSYDGQGYQQEAIIQLSNGWNPYFDGKIDGFHSLWINHYTKGPWYAAASLYKLVGRIEYAKIFNLLYIFSAFLLALSALLTLFKSKPKTAFLLALLFALNPVAVNQALSFYSDGQLASLLTIMVILSYLIIKKPTRLNLFLYALVIALALNIKFTAVAYVSVLTLGLVAGLLAYRQKETAAKVYIITTISYMVGLAFIGFNPYITNTTQQGHPFYPLMGSGAVNIIDANMPADFDGKNRIEKLIKSLFAESSNAYTPSKSNLKIPLVVRTDEFRAFGLADARVAGFGPLFSGVVIFSILLAALFFYFTVYKKRATREGLAVFAFLSVILISSLVNPEVWWARYAPQIWLLPLIVLVATLYYERYYEYARQIKILCMAVVFLIAVNSVIITTYHLHYQFVVNKTLKQQLRSLSKSKIPILVDFNSFTSNRVRFKEVGIKHKEVDDLPDTPNMNLIDSETKVIIPN